MELAHLMGKLKSRLYQAPVQKSPVRKAFLDLGEDDRVARVLAALAESEEATPQTVADHTGYTYATITRTLQELEGRGWLSAKEIASSKRGRNPKAYSLTVSKTALQRHYNALLKERLATVESVLS